MGLISHPGAIGAISVDYEGKYAFSVGGNDLCMNQWAIDTQPVATAALMGGTGVTPFEKLIEGGADGEYSKVLP